MGKTYANPEAIFERLQGLYQSDPGEFDRLSGLLVQEELNRAPEEFRAQAYDIQRRLERQLGKYKDPLARMNAMVEIFWQQFRQFQAVLGDPQEMLEKKRRGPTAAKVIPFKPLEPHH